MIFGSNSKLSVKIFCWQLELQCHIFDIIHQTETEHIADFTFCICNSKDTNLPQIENPEQFYMNFVIRDPIPISMSLSQMKETDTEIDTEIQSILKTIRTGKCYEQTMKQYEKMEFQFREDCSLVLRGNRTLIP